MSLATFGSKVFIVSNKKIYTLDGVSKLAKNRMRFVDIEINKLP